MDFGLDATSVPVLQARSSEVRVIGLFEAGDLFGSNATPDAVVSGLPAYLEALGVPDDVLEPTSTSCGSSATAPAAPARRRPASATSRRTARAGFAIGPRPTTSSASSTRR